MGCYPVRAARHAKTVGLSPKIFREFTKRCRISYPIKWREPLNDPANVLVPTRRSAVVNEKQRDTTHEA